MLINGIEMRDDLPEGWNPYEVIAIFKCLDSEGDTRLCMRVSKGWTSWEAMGAIEGFGTSLNQDFQDSLDDDQSDSGSSE